MAIKLGAYGERERERERKGNLACNGNVRGAFIVRVEEDHGGIKGRDTRSE